MIVAHHSCVLQPTNCQCLVIIPQIFQHVKIIVFENYKFTFFCCSVVLGPERPEAVRPPVASLERRNFAYTRQQWTGKSPKQFLNDWTRKNLPKTASLSFERVEGSGGWWRAR